ncbi:MAG TPA: ATP-binding protein [Opitutales bacterium]|nr:ATP-binding protein [Opitutales bacterium]
MEHNQATQVICTLDSHRKTLTIANNGPTIKSKDVPYIFDLGYTCDKESLGLGLAYSKKMLEGMRGGIRLISRPNARWVQFRLYFPKYAELPSEARMDAIND